MTFVPVVMGKAVAICVEKNSSISGSIDLYFIKGANIFYERKAFQ